MPFRIFTPTRTAIPLLVSMMLASGVANTLLTKYQDQQCLDNCNNPDPKKRQHFEQPVIQTAQMFAGEMGCWLVVGATALHDRWGNGKTPSRHGYMPLDRESDHDGDANAVAPPLLNPSSPLMSNANPKAAFLDGWRVCLLALPAVCDICGTTLMNAGLLLVPASVYQMTRGALVLFVGAFSVMFLHRKLRLFQWISLGGVVLGVAIVGLAGAMYTDGNQVKASSADMSDPVRAIIGVLFVAFAQVFTASQFVLEEWIFEMSDVEPLNAVGWEGIFGFLATFASMILLHLSVGSKESGRHGYFDISHGLHQVVSNPAIFVSSILIMISIGCVPSSLLPIPVILNMAN